MATGLGREVKLVEFSVRTEIETIRPNASRET
jgi:hypothetical protein